MSTSLDKILEEEYRYSQQQRYCKINTYTNILEQYDQSVINGDWNKEDFRAWLKLKIDRLENGNSSS